VNPGNEPGPLALVGSGEYLEEMADVEASLLAGRPGRYVQIATAAVPDGADVVARWHRLGTEQARRLGVEPIILDVANREDANDPEIVRRVAGAGLIYLSGGHPAFLADTLRDSALWSAVVDSWRSGAALAGCSAGAMALTSWIPSLRHPRRGSTPGLGLLSHLRVIPHFDAFSRRVPDLVTQYLVLRDPSVSVLGIDENTALIGGPFEWTVRGHASVWRLDDDGREQFRAGATLSTP
jgi:cyanophycinase